MTTTRNPFTARIAQAAQEGYIGTPRNRRPRTGTGSRLAALEADQTPGVPLVPMATPKQVAFITDLLADRDFSGEERPAWQARIEYLALTTEAREAMSQSQASAFIEYALGMPGKARTPEAVNQDGIPAGRYAVPNHMLTGDTADNSVSFFKVDRPESGRWSGYTFISRQAGGDFLRMNRRQQDEAKKAIREFGFPEASRLYGLELGHCGVCGRELTNETSREEGIGPVCRDKMGW